MRELRIRRLTPELHAAHAAEATAAIEPIVDEGTRVLQSLGLTGVANEWLAQMPWKQTVASLLYGDVLASTSRRRIIEVGGGLSGITLHLAPQHDYTLLERANHEAPDAYRAVERAIGRSFVVTGDWAAFDPPPHSTVFALDLFPNVDQRLYEFIDRFLAGADEMRLTLTYYEHTFFEVTRDGSGERLTMKPWGLREVSAFVEWLADRCGVVLSSDDRGSLVYQSYEGTLFRNRRNVLLVWIGPERN